jgi:hypothetical protein
VADHALCTLGAFSFRSTRLRIGRRQRSVGLSANALAPFPVQTTDYISGYRQIDIDGYLRGIETVGESRQDHLQRLWDNLETECLKDINTLIIDFVGTTTPRTYTVHKNDDGLPEFDVLLPSQMLSYVTFSLTLNCLP